MSRMTPGGFIICQTMIQNSIKKNGFIPDPQNPQITVTRFIRPFYAIAFAVMYEHETGFMYGVQFDDEVDLIAYMNGEFFLSSSPYLIAAERITYRPRIEFLSALNLCRVNTERQFNAAFAIAEHIVEFEILGIKHPVKIGDRVLYDHDGELIPATVTRYDADGVRVHIVAEQFRVTVPTARLRKLSDHLLTA